MNLLGCCLTFPTEELLRLSYRVLIYLAHANELTDGSAKMAISTVPLLDEDRDPLPPE